MTARATMASLITELRGMCEAGTADYTVASTTYWTDDQLQAMLDMERTVVNMGALSAEERYNTGGTAEWKIYRAGVGHWESLPTISDSTGVAQGTANYTFDANTGDVTFTADQAGTAYFITGTYYNLNAAAASVWSRKAGHYALAYDFSTDNHSMKRSQMIAHCKSMRDLFNSEGGGLTVGHMERSDTTNVSNWD